jgi:hypothetical protein
MTDEIAEVKHRSLAVSDASIHLALQELRAMQRVFKSRVFPTHPFDISRPLHGIIRDLNRLSGAVEISGTNPVMEGYEWRITNLLDFDTDSQFYSTGVPGAFVSYRFIAKSVIVTRYVLRSNYGLNAHNLRKWRLEVADDGENWTIVDERESDQLCGRNVTAAFETKAPKAGKWLKLTQTGRNSSDFDNLVVSAFEVFGTVLDE